MKNTTVRSVKILVLFLLIGIQRVNVNVLFKDASIVYSKRRKSRMSLKSFRSKTLLPKENRRLLLMPIDVRLITAKGFLKSEILATIRFACLDSLDPEKRT